MENIIKTSKGDVLINGDLNVKSPAYQSMKLHYERKRSLGKRLEPLRHYLRLLYGEYWIDDSEHHEVLESALDSILVKHDYDIDSIIDTYREIVESGYC